MLLRHVDDSDVYRIFRWRNDAESRRFSGSDKATKWQAHCAWFASTLPNPFWFIGLADVGDRETANGIAVGQAAALVPVGVARFDRTVDGHAISVTVDPLLHGRGFGSGLIARATAVVSREVGGTVTARVHAMNIPSRRAFTSAGYVLRQPCDVGAWLLFDYKEGAK